MKVVKIGLGVSFESIPRYLNCTSSPWRHHMTRTRSSHTSLCYVTRFSTIVFLVHFLDLLKI
ncbi:unnamed protein product [Brassica rapa subsp. trilocularis]